MKKNNGSFKNYINSINNSSYPFKFLIQNSEEFKEKEREDDINQSQEEKDIESKKSLLQYLQNANAAQN